MSLIKYAESVIASTYGDNVSVMRKAKPLIKFGENTDLDTVSDETIWDLGGNEDYQTSNSIDTISSSSASDTNTVTVEGHTIDGNGDFTFSIQTATLNGQNKVVLSTPLARANRVYNTSSASFVGNVYVYRDTTISGGVPSDLSFAHLSAPPESNQSLKAASTISKDDYYIITKLVVGVRRANTAVCDFNFQVREKGGVFRTKIPLSASRDSGSFELSFEAPLIVPKNADFRFTAGTSANNTQVDAIIFGYLATII